MSTVRNNLINKKYITYYRIRYDIIIIISIGTLKFVRVVITHYYVLLSYS